MRIRTCLMGCVAALVFLGLSLPLAAQEAPMVKESGWYLKTDIGVSMVDDWDMTATYTGLFTGRRYKSTATMEFDPGVRFDVGVGYEFCRWFAAELETGFVYNPVDKFKTDDEETSLSDVDLWQVPALINLIFKYPIALSNGGRLVPMIGGGGGVVYVDLEGDGGNSDTAAGAFQGLAGVKYEFNENAGLGFNYKYLVAYEPDLFDGLFTDVDEDSIGTHALTLEFSWRF